MRREKTRQVLALSELKADVDDMTYESVVGDYDIIPKLQRSIRGDIRSILFVTEKFLKAANIIAELGLS